MNQNIQSRRTRKVLLVLPLFIIPVLIFVFWQLKRSDAKATGMTTNSGLNTRLPGAQFDKHAKVLDKMSFYQQAKQDSGKAKLLTGNPLLQKFGLKPNSAGTVNNPTPVSAAGTDPNVSQINQKIAEISRQISQPVTPSQSVTYRADNAENSRSFDQEVSKLEAMMGTMNNSQAADPQMQQLSGLLGQIQAIQKPGTAKPIEKRADAKPDTPFRAIPAVIDGGQKVLQGGVVRIRLTDTVRVKGALLAKGQLMFGSCDITNQRLLLEIKNIRLGHAIIPVSLTVFSLDGLPGIPAPEAEFATAGGEGTGNALQDMQLLSMDQTVATQAASAGIDAAKGLLSKKVRRIKVKLQNDFPILLRNNNQR